MSKLILDIDFAAGGNSAGFVLDGWAEQEPKHRWTMGRESRLRLPCVPGEAGRVLAISATPCLHPPHLTGQAVMLALDGRLLATIRVDALRVFAFRLPAALAADTVLSITHLSAGLPRAPAQIRRGEPLGLMIHNIRVFRLDDGQPAVPGNFLPATTISPTVEHAIKSRQEPDLARLAARFESLGQGCQFGLVQRQCGIEPLGLLRFVDTTTSFLTDGLVAGFRDIGAPGRLELFLTIDAEPRYRWEHRDYRLLYDTRLRADEHAPEIVQHQQSQRLAFLQRKFIEDLREGAKIFVLTRGEPLAEEEALAVFCALQLHGPNTLLWTVASGTDAAGHVEQLQRGFLRGHLGPLDQHGYGAFEPWVSLMKNASRLSGA